MSYYSSPTPPLSPTKRARQCSLRKIVHCRQRHRLNRTMFQVPGKRKEHWSAPEKSAYCRVSAHLSLAQQVQEILASREAKEVAVHLQSTLGFGPAGLLSLPESHHCDADTHSLPFQFCHLLLLAFSISRCWRRGPKCCGYLARIWWSSYISKESSPLPEGC